MNRDWVLFHLAEAADALRQTISDIEASPDYDDPEFAVDMQHIYHHVNTAWNSRHSSDAGQDTDAVFTASSQFPSDLDMMSL